MVLQRYILEQTIENYQPTVIQILYSHVLNGVLWQKAKTDNWMKHEEDRMARQYSCIVFYQNVPNYNVLKKILMQNVKMLNIFSIENKIYML